MQKKEYLSSKNIQASSYKSSTLKADFIFFKLYVHTLVWKLDIQPTKNTFSACLCDRPNTKQVTWTYKQLFFLRLRFGRRCFSRRLS